MKLSQKLFFILTILYITYTNSQELYTTSELDSFKQEFRKFFINKMKKHHVTGMSVAIEVEGQLILDEGFGFADKENNIKATKNTEYPIGSVSKIITSTAILKLCTDGLIDLDAPYTKYVPDFQMNSHFENDGELTVRHLLSHYAGLPRLLAKGFMKKEPESLENLLEYSKGEYLIAKPGRVYQYSDWGVDLLSLLVERVSGMTYEDYVQNQIFNPLEMHHSYFGPVKQTKGYKLDVPTETYKYSYSGSDGVTSSASDLLKIVRLYMGNDLKSNKTSLISNELIRESLKEQFKEASLAFDTGIGLMWELLALENGYTRVKKAGVHEPFYSYIFFIPELQTSIAVCSNSNSSSAIHWESWGRLYKMVGKKYKSSGALNTKRDAPNPTRVVLTDEEFKTVEGSYSTSIGILNLKRNGKRFDVDLKSENKKGIGVPYSDGLIKLYVKALGVRIHAMDVFWKESDGEVIIGEEFESGARHILGSKIKSIAIPKSWERAVGRYRVVNYDKNDYKTFDFIELLVNRDNILELRGHTSFPTKMKIQLGLSPISEKLAVIPGYNMDFFGGETIKLTEATKGESILTLSGYKFKKMKE